MLSRASVVMIVPLPEFIWDKSPSDVIYMTPVDVIARPVREVAQLQSPTTAAVLLVMLISIRLKSIPGSWACS